MAFDRKANILYNHSWSGTDAIAIEMACIQKGGTWKGLDGQTCGNGLFFHYKRLMHLLWPGEWWSRWDDLILTELTSKPSVFVGIAGPSSSSKTHRVSRFALCLYFCFPNSCTILCSTTTRELLEMRIFGEIKKGLKKARERVSWLPGNFIESRQLILTDDKEIEEGREIRNCIKGVACFLSGTLVDTPSGPVKIEDVKIGDCVVNAFGTGIVTETYQRHSPELVRVVLSDGRTIDCTPEHPFLTDSGWVKAVDLGSLDTVFSACETLRILRSDYSKPKDKPEILFRILSRLFARGSNVRLLQRAISSVKEAIRNWKSYQNILQPFLFLQVECGESHSKICNKTLQPLRQADGFGSSKSQFLFEGVPGKNGNSSVSALWKGVSINHRPTPTSKKAFLQSILCAERDEESTTLETYCRNPIGIGSLEAVPFCDLESSFQNRIEAEERLGALVQDRPRIHGRKTGRGDRWWNSPDAPPSREGSTPYNSLGGTRVDRVEILELGSNQEFTKSESGYRVHNLEVSGHPSYSVNGVIVHNCKKGGQWEGLGDYIGIKNDIVMVAADEAQLMESGFFDSIGNLASNPRFILVGMGNPKDTTDSFGKLCEPLNGWDVHEQGETSTAWDTRFRNGRCLRLVGTDSPNLDRKDGLIMFPKLIGPRYINEIADTYGKESWQYLMWVLAKFPLNSQLRRVITMAMCRRFGAFEPAQFADKVKKLFAMDAAYSAVGGDRCVGMEFWFGKCTDGVNRLALVSQPMVVPVSADKGIPEDQIATWTKEYCEAREIPPQNFFFDGTGRSSLTSAMARIWSPQVVPIEFGGLATDRPSPQDPRKTCREMYGKFVTELWWTWRVVTEADQIRGITEEIANEGQLRAWNINNSGKVDVEKKEDTKLRLGRSPDLADTVVTAIEGARRLGFQIGKLGSKTTGQSDSELLKLRNKWLTTLKSRDLKAA